MHSAKTLIDCPDNARNVAKWRWRFTHIEPLAGNDFVGLVHGKPVKPREPRQQFQRTHRRRCLIAKLSHLANRKREQALRLKLRANSPKRLRTPAPAADRT